MNDCLGCQRCEDGPMVTLWDGRLVCNTCDDWRTECEARRLLTVKSMKKIGHELQEREKMGRDVIKLKRYMRGIYDSVAGLRDAGDNYGEEGT